MRRIVLSPRKVKRYRSSVSEVAGESHLPLRQPCSIASYLTRHKHLASQYPPQKALDHRLKMAPPTADFVSASTQDHPHQLKNVDAHLPKPSSASAVTTSTRLPSAAESNQIAESWLKSFEASVASQQIDAVLELFHENAYWKDLLTLEWQHHTKHGKEVIKKWLLQGNKLWKRKLTNVKLENGSAASLEAAPGVPCECPPSLALRLSLTSIIAHRGRRLLQLRDVHCAW